MGKLPALTARTVIAALEKAGFAVHHVTGGHHIMRHKNNVALRVTVPFHSRDLKTGTLRRIVKDAGLTVEEFEDLL
ncbi:MAG: type II toxin-antitoxin system HicA family toxin [Rhodomicrobium sp.]